MLVTTDTLDVAGPAGPIRCVVARPKTVTATATPAIVCWSDIFQHTPSTVRTLQRLASYGFIVVAPELYGRFEPAGTVLDFDADRQRALDDAERVSAAELDADTNAVVAAAKQLSRAGGVGAGGVGAGGVGALGFCFGGHVAFRAAFSSDVKASACCYGTGIHNGKLGATADAGTLARVGEIGGELLLVWGRNDPHIPADGRARIHRALDDARVRFEARLYDAEHAFMRDVGPRSDPAAADHALTAIVELFRRTL